MLVLTNSIQHWNVDVDWGDTILNVDGGYNPTMDSDSSVLIQFGGVWTRLIRVFLSCHITLRYEYLVAVVIRTTVWSIGS